MQLLHAPQDNNANLIDFDDTKLGYSVPTSFSHTLPLGNQSKADNNYTHQTEYDQTLYQTNNCRDKTGLEYVSNGFSAQNTVNQQHLTPKNQSIGAPFFTSALLAAQSPYNTGTVVAEVHESLESTSKNDRRRQSSIFTQMKH